jgi:hypothetical protein
MPTPDPSIDLKELSRSWRLQTDALKRQYSLANIAQQFCKASRNKPYHLLRVTAVLTVQSDGSEALGEWVDGQLLPAEPHLRDSAIHKKPDDNFIKDWINHANLSLLFSGANFGLDTANIRYVLEKNDMLHRRECSNDGKHEETCAFIADKSAESESSPYRDSVILIFRWGTGTKPTGQGCSSVRSPYILMGRYETKPRWMDGRLVPRHNNLLAHELGHFMGLVHPFPNLALELEALARLGGRNWKRLPLIEANLGQMNQVTQQELEAQKTKAIERIATWPWTLEQDTGAVAMDGIEYVPKEYGIGDTPVDLGWGLPLLHGHTALEGVHHYSFERYARNDLAKEEGDDWWAPKPGTLPTITDSVTLHDTVRRNIMSYWAGFFDHAEHRFSADQVKRMHYVLDTWRSGLIGRTVNRRVCVYNWLPPQMKEIIWPRWWPDFLPKYEPWPVEVFEQHIRSLHQAGRLVDAEQPSADCGVDETLWEPSRDQR